MKVTIQNPAGEPETIEMSLFEAIHDFVETKRRHGAAPEEEWIATEVLKRVLEAMCL